MNEHKEQKALFDWAALAVGVHPELALMFAIPNGGYRNKVTAARMKAEGVKAGVPDICLPVARNGYHGLWIEMKSAEGRMKKHQRAFCQRLAGHGYRVVVCWSWDAARREIESYLKRGAFELPAHHHHHNDQEEQTCPSSTMTTK